MLAKPLIHLQPLSRKISPMMPKDLKDLLRLFNQHGVKYLIVGGYAYGVHAEPRQQKISTSLSDLMTQTAKLYFVRSRHLARP
jgi:hypothetical protein